MTRGDAPRTALIGRDTESQALVERIDAAKAGRGGALVVRGAPGIGKTSVLESARAYATEAGLAVLRTTGVQSETHLPFAGLHHLLGPVLRDIDRLPDPYRKALQSAFGLIDESVTSPHLVAMAMLDLLGESAERAPLLVIVDDAQWLDASTAGALAFVARRLESEPIVLLAALRDGFASHLFEVGLTELPIAALSDTQAERLVDARAPTLDRELRDRVLRSAAGNPLALVELSTALRSSAETDRVLWGSDLPLTARLERAFADRLASLAPSTGCFLRVASADEGGQIAELLAAASQLAGREVTLEAATEAEQAGLVEVEGPQIRFRHPLMRSAIHRAMSHEEQQAAHLALAATLQSHPDRCTWHRAAATVGSNEQISTDLAMMGWRAYMRGAVGVAIEATDRATRFTEDLEKRSALLIRAASFAWLTGRAGEVLRFLDRVDDAHVPAVERPHVRSLREMYGRGTPPGPSELADFIASTDRLRADGHVDRGLATLYVIAFQCWWSNPGEATIQSLVSTMDRFVVPEDDPRVINILALSSPVEHGTIVLDRLRHRSADLTADFKGDASKLGLAALSVGDFVLAERFLEAHTQFCRAQGMLGGLVVALVQQTWTKILRGDWRGAASLANEAMRLGEETGQQNWTAAACLEAATIAAYRGEVEEAERLTTEGERGLFIAGANPRLAMVQWPRGVAALAAGRHDEAYQHLSRIFEPTDIAFHPHLRSWVLVDLVEAAVLSGHDEEAAALVRELEPVATRSRSPLLDGAMRCARPMLSPDADESAYQAEGELTAWPFTRARLQLAYGAWLRRHNRRADSRAPLRAARDLFDTLGAAPWGERARLELRASGETSRRRSYDLIDALSPQELQIAQMAAAGLSNKEIGQQLFLSHRTISTHLYNMFPKLGITARSHLHAALQDRSTPQTS